MKTLIKLMAAALLLAGCTAEPLPSHPAVPGRPKHQSDTLRKGVNIVKTDADPETDTTKATRKVQPGHIITLPIYAGE